MDDKKSEVTEPEVKTEGEEKKSITQKISEVFKGKKAEEVIDETTAEDKKDDSEEEKANTDEQMTEALRKAGEDAVDAYIKAQEEKARKESLTPEELKAEEEQAKDSQIAKLEHDILVRDCRESAVKDLDTAGLPVSLADILDYTSKETATQSLAVVKKTFADCLEQGIKERLKGKTPEGLNTTTSINDYADMTARARKAAGLPEEKKG